MSCEDLPPPAYSEQEFDRKISTVLEASLAASQPPITQPDEEVWEQWDEVTFETAARATLSTSPSWSNQAREGSLSQHVNIGARSIMPAHIEPLRIHKKSAAVGKSSLPKTRHGECRGEITDELLTYRSQPNVRAGTSSQPGVNDLDHTTPEPTSQTIHSTVSVLEEYEFSSPPPPFSPAELNPDGTPIVIMSYNPSVSPPPSPLISPLLSNSSLPDHQLQPPQLQPHPLLPQQPMMFHDVSAPHRHIPYHSLPAPPRSSNNQLGKRPGTSPGLKFLQASRVPGLSFDPLIAYNRQSGSSLPLTPAQCTQPEFHMQSFSANAFYNSAVSAYLPNSHTSSVVSSHGGTGQQPPYQAPSGYDSGNEQIRQPNFHAPQHAALSVNAAVRMNCECQNPMNHAASRRSAYVHR
ncbi:hypothetical protein BDZ94DRAFT_501511 [Collybia nuda]|uniref:Uncharacterized protein n=1 Tax=Collybia nuda TaxID=64659 RepID=A0A9P5XSH0_9AGAR|nr:hypothetical protein BDZ94DRAFT_501511 [Collybia nuda]